MHLTDRKYCYVVDDDDAFRDSLATLIDAAGYSCRAFAAVADFVNEIELLQPGVLLLDLRIPYMGGLNFLEGGTVDLDRFAIIMVSGHGDIERAVRSIKAGAIEFIEKPFETSELLNLLEAAYRDLEQRLANSSDRRDAARRVATLSPRESEVLRILLSGAPNKIVARHLDLSVRTVEMHRAHMLTKLRARTTAEALHLAMLADLKPW